MSPLSTTIRVKDVLFLLVDPSFTRRPHGSPASGTRQRNLSKSIHLIETQTLTVTSLRDGERKTIDKKAVSDTFDLSGVLLAKTEEEEESIETQKMEVK